MDQTFGVLIKYSNKFRSFEWNANVMYFEEPCNQGSKINPRVVKVILATAVACYTYISRAENRFSRLICDIIKFNWYGYSNHRQNITDSI